MSIATGLPEVILRVAAEDELDEFKRRLQRSFLTAAVAELGWDESEPIPSDEDIEDSFRAPRAQVLQVMHEGVSVGGMVLSFDEGGERGSLDLFFLDEPSQGKGIGQAAWCAVERRYPSVRLWETVTLYFEKRNIHFYVNKCGFHIVEFFHPGHPEPHKSREAGEEPDYMFRFEKAL
ncbi:Uncharacterised protein [Actinomyces bovis]|uniref:N-acetyltransferase domain-containing protein n=1 Tax=Actinomyces bovis TaxID=1658 RepID=A0ABY1VM53_9ACTO|nr:GNAT family N-acetyltransferase [Actinomyces bovis]SPT53189.1 Uncharacterised protein [Actinomyces bovis]VEG52405.1 Uncharacterised protein [Actinomyces israelii]